MFLALVLDSIAIAGQAIAGRLLGAGDVVRARAATRRMIELSVLVGVVLAVAVLVTRPFLPSLFTTDVRVEHLAAFVLVFVALQQPANAVTFAIDGILIGAGDVRFLAWAMAAAAAVYVPTLLVVLALGLGIGWVWAAFSLFQLLRLAALVVRWQGESWLITGAER
jgi:Na+-driven multidrug efflux pump